MAIIGISGRIGSGKDTVGAIIQYLASKSTKDINEWLELEQNKRNSYSHWIIKKYAGKLKEIVSILTGIPVEDLEKQEVKNKVLGEEWNVWKVLYNNNFDSYWKLFSSKEEAISWIENCSDPLDCGKLEEEILTPRKLLQCLGTDLLRDNLHPNVHINALFANYNPICKNKCRKQTLGNPEQCTCEEDCIGEKSNWIITDLRFENELKAIKDRDGISIRVNRNINCTEENLAQFNHSLNHPSETSLDSAEFDYVIDNNEGIPELIEKVKQILIKENII